MRKSSDNTILFSATDLSNHIHCKHLTNLNKDVVEGFLKKPISTSKTLDVLRERGLEFEKSFLDEIEKSGKTNIQIESFDSDAHFKTLEAMRLGVDYIYQAKLSSEEWQGWADFLIKIDTKSNLGEWSYEVLDTKLASQTRAGTILQIALYSEIL